MLTRRGKAALIGFLVLLVAGRVLGVTELFGIAVAIGAVVLVSAIRIRSSHVRAAISARLSPEVIEAQQPTVLELFIENTGAVPTPANRLQLLPTGGGLHRILIPRLAPGERAAVTIGLDSSRRGKHAIKGYDVVLHDGLGLASHRLVSTGGISYLVRPRTEELPRLLPLSAGLGGQESTRSEAERIATGASMLRGYVPGDDLRRIHWPTTARVGELMVREGGDPDSSNRSGTTIVLGTNRGGGERFERAVEVAASLALAAQREGMVRLLTTTGYDSGLAYGPAHFDEISLELASVQPLDAPLPRRHRRGRVAAEGSPDGLGPSGTTAGAGFEGNGDGGGRSETLLRDLFGRGAIREEWNVLVTVEGVARLEDAELGPDLLAGLSVPVGNVVLVLVGGDVPRFERLDRNAIAVFLPVGRAMHDIWNTALDLPIGEARAVDGGEHGLELPVRPPLGAW